MSSDLVEIEVNGKKLRVPRDQVWKHKVGACTAANPRTRMNSAGEEVLSDVSLVAHTDMRPVTLGERIRRYIKTPAFAQDQLDEAGYHSEDIFDEDIPFEEQLPPTNYEDRYHELKEGLEKIRKEKIEKKKKEREEREKAEKEAFRKRYNELKDEGATPPAPSSKDGA